MLCHLAECARDSKASGDTSREPLGDAWEAPGSWESCALQDALSAKRTVQQCWHHAQEDVTASLLLGAEV